MASADEPESPISLSRFNIRTSPPKVRDTVVGKIRAFHTLVTIEWIYLVLALLALTICLGITIQRLTVEKPSDSDFTFAILLLVTIVFCYHYVVHSVFTERWDELMVFVVSNIIVLVYCVTNYINGTKAGNSQPTIKLVRLIVICIISPFLIIVGILQSYRYCRSNNLIFNTVGGVSSLQSACKMFYICSSLLMFDLQLQISMLILIMGSGVVSMSLTQIVILASGVPVTFIFIIIGYLGLRWENRTLMVLFYLLGLLEPAYIIYKFFYTAKHGEYTDATYDSTFACGYFALVIWVLLIISTVYFVVFYFGKGLKEKMFGDKSVEEPHPTGMENEVVSYEVGNADETP